jgi:hypothetical protein
LISGADSTQILATCRPVLDSALGWLMPGGVSEKAPELDGLPSDAVEVLEDAEGDLPLVPAKAAVDVIGAKPGVASSIRRDKARCAAKQFGSVHAHILRCADWAGALSVNMAAHGWLG